MNYSPKDMVDFINGVIQLEQGMGDEEFLEEVLEQVDERVNFIMKGRTVSGPLTVLVGFGDRGDTDLRVSIKPGINEEIVGLGDEFPETMLEELRTSVPFGENIEYAGGADDHTEFVLS